MVPMVWTGEEDPYIFLANSENVGFPIVFLGFPIIPVGYLFSATRKPWFSIGLTRFPALIFFDMFVINGPWNPSTFHVIWNSSRLHKASACATFNCNFPGFAGMLFLLSFPTFWEDFD